MASPLAISKVEPRRQPATRVLDDRVESDRRAPEIKSLNVPQRRLLGAYYTPDDFAGLVTQWALSESIGPVLDPSFGGCAFTEAAAATLRRHGCPLPGNEVFGVDVDEGCARYVRKSDELILSNFVFRDFLSVRPGDLPGAPFQAIVGNPPYVRHHWLKDERRVVARRIAEESGQRLPGTASLWAYFVLHSLAFLRQGGRIGMLVPEAILQANYAVPVRDALEMRFRRVRLIHLRQRLFEGTDEPVVVIAAEGFGWEGALEVQSVDTASELKSLLRGDVPVQARVTTLLNGRRVETMALRTLERIAASGKVEIFGKLASAHIGVVTGANSHFIRSAADLEQMGVGANNRLGIVSRTKWFTGLEFTGEDHQAVAASGACAFLVRPTQDVESEPGLQRWIKDGEKANVDMHHKCSVRHPWYQVEIPEPPNAFVTSTRLGPPRLVLNQGKFHCTNGLYAAWWRPKCRVPPEVVALGFLTTLVALWSEVNGRRYGGGVLKLDLTTLGSLPVPIVPGDPAAFQLVDEALRRGDEAAARALADDVVLCQGLGISEADLRLMREALAELTRQRIPKSRES